MATALVGFTGFVGSTLLAQQTFDDLYNSKNIEEIAGKKYDLIVCAGMPAEKWKANQQPENDWQNTQHLMNALGKTTSKRFVLVSTVDVYASALNVDERTPIDDAVLQTYGLNRHRIETFVADKFPSHSIVRLPGLFGKGLKKNFLFDMLRGTESPWTDYRSKFQFYDMSRLWDDFETTLRNDLSVVNFATPPMQAAEVALRCFNQPFSNATVNPPVSYDMRTQYARFFGEDGPYLYSADECFERIKSFVAGERIRMEGSSS